MTDRAKPTGPEPDLAQLRQLAEQRLAGAVDGGAGAAVDEPAAPAASEDLARLNHELRVHEIELQMQNEVLISTQLELEKSAQRYRRLYEQAPIGYVTLDRHGTVLEANPRAARVLGMPLSEVRGCKLSSFMQQPAADEFHRHRYEVFEGEGTAILEISLQGADDVTRWVHMESALATDPAGDQPTCGSVLEDITDRVSAHQALDEGGARFDAIFMTATDAIITIDERGIIDSVNPAMLKMFGYEAHEVIGQNVRMLMPEPDRSQHDHYVQSYLLTGVPHVIGAGRTVTAQHKDGRTFPIRLSVSEIVDGVRLGFAAFLHDLSEEDRIKEHLLNAQKLEAVGTLASGIAHDFNNLLTGIVGCAERILRAAAETDPAARHALDIREAALGGAAIVKQLMSYGHERSNGARVVELDGVLRGMEVMLSRLIGEDIDFQLDLGAPAGAVRVGEGEVERILTNLVINARHAMPDGGTLRLESFFVEMEQASEVEGKGPGRYVVFTLTDSGAGMDAETRRRIFEPFFTTKAPGEGTGLGLSTAFAILRQRGGDITVDSAPGKGSTFTVMLPRVTGLSTPPCPEPEPAPGNGQTILVVEDEPLVSLTVVEYLGRAGYRVLSASDGPRACELLEAPGERIDLVLTDIVLPGGLTGPQIAAEARRRRPGTAIMFMSAHANDWLVREGRLGPGTASLQKPFTEHDLLLGVSHALQGRLAVGTGAQGSDRRQTLLLVDDDDTAREAYRELFVQSGYRVLDAATGGAALELLREHGEAIDLLITDIGLPDIDGETLAAEARALLPQLPVVFATGRSTNDPTLSGEPDARTRWVEKPVDFDALEQTVRSLLPR